MAIIIELAHEFSRKETDELAEYLGISGEDLIAAEKADHDKPLTKPQLMKLAGLNRISYEKLLEIDVLYQIAWPDQYHEDMDGDEVMQWDDEYYGDGKDMYGDDLMITYKEVDHLRRAFYGFDDALERLYFKSDTVKRDHPEEI